MDLSPATHQESNTKLVDNSMEMGTFISNATMMLPSAQCEGTYIIILYTGNFKLYTLASVSSVILSNIFSAIQQG